jgi:hypothetical protein
MSIENGFIVHRRKRKQDRLLQGQDNRKGIPMKKFMALLLMGILAFALVGCGGSWTTEEYDGYSFEVNSSWEKERYDDNIYIYYLEGDSDTEEGVWIMVYESESSFAYETFDEQSESLQRISDGYISEDGTSGWRCSNLEITNLGAYAFARYTQTSFSDGEDTWLSQCARFFVNSNHEITISLDGPLEKVPQYQRDLDRLLDSITLT